MLHILETVERAEDYQSSYEIAKPEGISACELQYHIDMLYEISMLHPPMHEQKCHTGNISYIGHDC